MRLIAVMAVVVVACAAPVADELRASESSPPISTSTSPPSTAAPIVPTTTTSTEVSVQEVDSTPELPDGVIERPAWLGQRPLPLRPDGFGEVLPTPTELIDRRLVTVDELAAPPVAVFESNISPVPDHVLERSTWHQGCPVPIEELRYITVAFWGFDLKPHTGEIIVAQQVAEDVVWVFERLWDERFPIEEMRVISAAELDDPPTGDGNVTTGFVCRPVVTSGSWSQHAFGLAVDINPFHNPYHTGDLVIPELASAYVDRTFIRPGMIIAGDAVTAAFEEIGWGWGGDWITISDPMHFSLSGR